MNKTKVKSWCTCDWGCGNNAKDRLVRGAANKLELAVLQTEHLARHISIPEACTAGTGRPSKRLLGVAFNGQATTQRSPHALAWL